MRKHIILAIVYSVLILAALTFYVTTQNEYVSLATGDNLLQNPSFEGDYVKHSATAWLADKWDYRWEPWHHLPPVSGGTMDRFRMPEYKELTKAIDARRIFEGDKAQCFFVFYGVMDATIQQTVNVPRGQWFQANVAAQAYSNDKDEPQNSPGDMYVVVGIDPEGGVDPYAVGVVWSKWEPVGNKYERIESRMVRSESEAITVFFRAFHKWALKHGDIYLDDAHLYLVSGNTQNPTPEPCPTTNPCPTPSPSGTYPSLEQIQTVIREEIMNREPVRWP